MVIMAKPKKPASKPNRSPSWKVFVRVPLDLEEPIKAHMARQPYAPSLAQIVERGLRLVLEEERKRKEGAQ